MTAEVFRLTDEAGQEKCVAVDPLRQWAEENCELCGIQVDWGKVEDMLSHDKIDRNRLQNYTMTRLPKPIIVCENFMGNASEIIDGNHTYVAAALMHAMAAQAGISLTKEPVAIGYVVTREQMEMFLVPAEALAD